MRNRVTLTILFFTFLFFRTANGQIEKPINEINLDFGITNNDTYSFLLIEESRHSSLRRELLEKALRYSPDLPATYFMIACDRFGLSPEGIFDALDHSMEGIKVYNRNFLWRLNLWNLIIRSFVISFFASIFIYFIIRFPAFAGLIMHEIRENRRKFLLLFLPLLFSIFGLLPLLASLVSLHGLYIWKRDRLVIYLSFVILLFFSLSPSLLRIFHVPSHLKAVTAVNESRDNKYGLLKLKGRNDLPSSFAYALALKREGLYGESIEYYKGLMEKYQLPEVYINRGNALYAAGDLEGAIESYSRSLSMKPLTAAYYNLSQVYREMLDFKRGEEYFEAAARLDSVSLRRYTTISDRNPNRFVVDVRLPDIHIFKQLVGENGPIIKITSLTFVTSIAILSFFIIERVLKSRARKCRRCGSIYCNRCSRMITWKDMCSRCYGFLVRMDQMYSKERLANLISLYHGKARKRTIAKILSYLLPGAGQIYSGKIIEGFLLSWASIFALVVIVLSRVMTDGIYPFHHNWLLPPLMLIIIIVYVISILHIRREIQKGWL